MHQHKKKHSVLSVYPTPRGFAFVLFDSALSPHDWGTKSIQDDIIGAKCAGGIRELVGRFRPDVLVIERVSERPTRKTARLQRIVDAVCITARSLSVEVAYVGRHDVKAAFAQFGATNKHDIASVIARKMEPFASRIPKPRTRWGTEDPRMALFDAASRGLTYYYQIERAAE